MIFIVGVNNHYIQYVKREKMYSAEFENCLVDKINKHSISLVAEELSKEAIDNRKHAIDSVARVTALSTSRKHLYADPDSKERELLRIPKDTLTCSDEDKAKYNHIREKEWLSRIKNQSCPNVLFICGCNHVDSFDSLLRNEGHQVKVLSTNYGI